MPESKDKKPKKLFAMIDEILLTKEDFVASWEQVVGIIEALKKENGAFVSKLDETYQTAQTKLSQDSEFSRSEMQTLIREELTSMMRQLSVKIAEVDQKLSEVRDGKDADEKTIVEAVRAQIQLPEYKEVIMDNAEQLRDKLETLEGDARPVWINDFEKKLTEHEERMQRIASARVLAGPNANAVQYADLSSQCDGSTKTFTVPRHRHVIALLGTQFPTIYRPTTDFTTANLQLTLTSQVSAPASGQTLTFLYVK